MIGGVAAEAFGATVLGYIGLYWAIHLGLSASAFRFGEYVFLQAREYNGTNCAFVFSLSQIKK